MLDTIIYREKLCKTWITATMHGNDISKTFDGILVKGIEEIFVSEHEDDKAGGPLMDMAYRAYAVMTWTGYAG
jgi:uncharacterized protein (UPF0276 family)